MLKHQVRDLYDHYNRLLDDGRADDWAGLFTADGVFDGPGRPLLTGSRELRDFAGARDPRGIRHLTFNLVVPEGADVSEGGATDVTADFVLFHVRGEPPSAQITALGRYADTLTRVGGRLLFARRVVTRIL